MILYGSSPDSLAQQQQNYDQMYGSANRANAEAASQAQMAQIQMALGQQNRQSEEAQRLAEMNQSQSFQAGQNALDRQSRLADVTAQYKFDSQLRDRTEVDNDFKNASRDAMGGALPADLNKLKQLFPHFDDSKINQLYQIAGTAAVARVQQSAALADKNGMPPNPSLVDAAGVPKGSDFEKQAHTIISVLRQPYESQYTKSADLAETGGRLQRIAQDKSAPPSNVGETDYAPSGWLNWLVTDKRGQVQPNPAVAPRIAAAQAAFAAAQRNPNAMITPSLTGTGYTSQVPANWAPAFAGRTATATPSPAAPLPPGEPASQHPKVITDNSGRRWIYKGSLPDPTQDKNPANWQPA
jgi:hypothetical protein